MKTYILTLFAGLLFMSLIFSSCSVQKRHYRPGFHIEANKHAPVKNVNKDFAKVDDVAPVAARKVISDNTTEETVVAADEVASADLDALPVLEPKQTAKKYSNAVSRVEPVKEKGSKKFQLKKKANAGNAYKASPSAILGSDKLIAILLCIFLGFLGIHRFYLGYPLSAIVYIALFVAAVVFGGWILGPIGWVCGVILFVLVVLDLIFLILDMPLIFQA